MSTVETKLLTADEFWEWCQVPANAGKRVELERGEIVEMPPPFEDHGLLCGWISHLLWLYVGRRGNGGVASNDMGLVVEEDPATVRGPDVVFFGEAQPLGQGRKHSRRIPKLVVEVLSPNDKPNRTTRRIGEYLRRGVPLVWIVDPEDRTVAVHRENEIPRTLDEKDELTGEDALPDLKLPVADLFKLPGT
jgi:Uma2 family endonuclease